MNLLHTVDTEQVAVTIRVKIVLWLGRQFPGVLLSGVHVSWPRFNSPLKWKINEAEGVIGLANIDGVFKFAADACNINRELLTIDNASFSPYRLQEFSNEVVRLIISNIVLSLKQDQFKGAV